MLLLFFYNKWNCLKQNFSNTSELVKLHHLSIFFGGVNPPAKPVVAILLYNMSVKVVKRSLKVCKKVFNLKIENEQEPFK